MSDKRIDPETLAEFLEGRLAPQERERVLQALSDSPEAYADFLEAAAVDRAIGDVDSQAEPAGVLVAARPSIGTRRNRVRQYLAPALIAAGIVVVVVARRGDDAGRAEVIVLAQATHVLPAGTSSVAAKLGDSWNQPQWSVSRGGDDASTDKARAFRAGARVAELEVAAQAGDLTALRILAGSLIRLLASAQVGTPTITQLRDFEEPSAAARKAMAEQIRALLGAPSNFDAGVWTETARLSLASDRMEYFGAGSGSLARIIQELAIGASSEANSRLLAALREIESIQATSRADKDSLKRLVDDAIAAGAQ